MQNIFAKRLECQGDTFSDCLFFNIFLMLSTVKESVTVPPWFEDDPMKFRRDGAERSSPSPAPIRLEFNVDYQGKPFPSDRPGATPGPAGSPIWLHRGARNDDY